MVMTSTFYLKKTEQMKTKQTRPSSLVALDFLPSQGQLHLTEALGPEPGAGAH